MSWTQCSVDARVRPFYPVHGLYFSASDFVPACISGTEQHPSLWPPCTFYTCSSAVFYPLYIYLFIYNFDFMDILISPSLNVVDSGIKESNSFERNKIDIPTEYKEIYFSQGLFIVAWGQILLVAKYLLPASASPPNRRRSFVIVHGRQSFLKYTPVARCRRCPR